MMGRILLVGSLTVFAAAEVVPDVLPWANMGATTILGVICWRLIDRFDKLSESITALREHCAARIASEPTSGKNK